MLFRRNKTYQKTEPSQAKKSLLERLVILDANEMDSPEAEAEKIEEQDPSVDARVVRVRSFAPGRSMSDVPAEHTFDISELDETPHVEKKEFGDESPRPLHVERYEDAVSEVEDNDEDDENEEEEKEEINETIENLRAYAADPSEEMPVKKYFDILERAREQEIEVENNAGREEQVRIIYRVPKRSFTDASARNAIHNELIQRINNSIGDTSNIQEEIVSHFTPESIEILQEEISVPDLAEEIRAVVGDVSDEHVGEIIESALKDALGDGELEKAVISENEDEDEEEAAEGPHWVSGVEDVTDAPKMNHFEKVLFPEEYFYAKDGTVIKTVVQLHEALSNMNEETYNHHAVVRDTNDFANWIEGVYGHEELARRMKVSGGREDLLTILGMYM